MARERLHAWVTGRVQGVFFRDSTRSQARSLGLSGWVRNLPDGRVEVVAEGETAALQRMLAWLHQGPPYAYVDQVEVEWGEAAGEWGGFSIRF